jgi:hypothetical protein
VSLGWVKGDVDVIPGYCSLEEVVAFVGES